MRLGLTTAFILAVVPVTLHGQLEKIDALALEPGTRARILGAAPDSRFTLITVAFARPDSLHYSLGGSSNTALNELGGFFGGAFFGPIIGGTAGFFWRTEKWIPVYLPQPAITLNPAR